MTTPRIPVPSPGSRPRFPTDRAGRLARRAEIRGQVLARAEDEARDVGRSFVCTANNHLTCHGAAVCICECHDPEVGA